jgi:hypothetical protein
MNAICCPLNFDFFMPKSPWLASAKPNRDFPTKNEPIRRGQVTPGLPIAQALL